MRVQIIRIAFKFSINLDKVDKTKPSKTWMNNQLLHRQPDVCVIESVFDSKAAFINS